MTSSYRVLVLGSSDVTVTETDESGTLPALLQHSLQRKFPDAGWRVASALLYPTAQMRSRAEAEVDRVQPDLVHMALGTNTIAEKTVLFSIRRRWPLAYGPARRLIGAAKGVAGGGTEGSAGLRGAVFRLPRAAGRRLFGMASMLDPEQATSSTRETFEMFAARGFPVVVRLAEGGVQQAEQRAAAALITKAYNDSVLDLCERLGFRAFHLSTVLGDAYARTPDGLHAAYPSRVHSAEIVAGLIGKALGLNGGA